MKIVTWSVKTRYWVGNAPLVEHVKIINVNVIRLTQVQIVKLLDQEVVKPSKTVQLGHGYANRENAKKSNVYLVNIGGMNIVYLSIICLYVTRLPISVQHVSRLVLIVLIV
jgi:hypothetical protein